MTRILMEIESATRKIKSVIVLLITPLQCDLVKLVRSHGLWNAILKTGSTIAIF